MRIRKVLLVVLLTGLLSACLGGLITRAGTDLLLAVLKPMVGLDPNATSLFEHPAIKTRMQAFLGDQYEPAMQLISTANQLQQEGPLFFVVSRYTPIPEIAEKAGFVWNSETNQMALMLVTGGSPTVIAEQVLLKQANQAVVAAVPQWPVELQAILDQDALQKKAMEEAARLTSEQLRQQAEQELQRQLEAELPAVETGAHP